MFGAATESAVSQPVDDAAVVTKAVLRAAEQLGVSNRLLSSVLGCSEATVSRMGSSAYQLSPGSKPFELAVLFLRLYRSLDAIVGGDAAAARAWLQNDNLVLNAPPARLIASVAGLVTVVGYLDARRALV